MTSRSFAAAACLLLGVLAVSRHDHTHAANLNATESRAKAANARMRKADPVPARKVDAKAWDPKTAAAYLDQRAAWWMTWPKSARDHKTFCVSCHTAVPYAMSRPALRRALGEQTLSPNEQRLLENVTKRVRLWNEVEPFYSDKDRGTYKTVESRGTESVLNALILASHDAQTHHLSDDARSALANMWAEQQTSGEEKGAWRWLRFKNEPWEADDSDFYGASLAAIATGTAPENYRARPEIKNNLKLLRAYLDEHVATQTLSNRVVLLWASVKLPGTLSIDQQNVIAERVLSKQQPDGGWSLPSISGDWKRHDGTPQAAGSDGYATGLIAFALEELEFQRGDPPPKDSLSRGNDLSSHLQHALDWLQQNQNQTAGFWPSYSLNKNEANHIGPETVRFMNDAATAYAVLALNQATAHP